MAHSSRSRGPENAEPAANMTYKEVVLRYVIALHRSGKHLTIPALVRELIDDAEGISGGTKLECAVRDLDRDGFLCCRTGLLHPTAAGLHDASRPSLIGESRRSVA